MQSSCLRLILTFYREKRATLNLKTYLRYSSSLKSELDRYSDDGDLFARWMVCYSDARYHGSSVFRSAFGLTDWYSDHHLKTGPLFSCLKQNQKYSCFFQLAKTVEEKMNQLASSSDLEVQVKIYFGVKYSYDLNAWQLKSGFIQIPDNLVSGNWLAEAFAYRMPFENQTFTSRITFYSKAVR